MPTQVARPSSTRVVLTLFTVVVFISSILAPFAALATVSTDQQDYAPGSVVTISGDNSNDAGYLADETVSVAVSGPNGYSASCEGVADADGAWICQVTLWANELAVGSYSYTASGQTSGATETGTFTDAVTYHIESATLAIHGTDCTSGTSPFAPGDTVCASATVTGSTSGGGSGTNPGTLYVNWYAPSAGSPTFADSHDFTADGSYDSSHAVTAIGTWTVKACSNAGCTGSNLLATSTFTVSAVSDTTAPAVTYSQSPNGSNGWFKVAPASATVTATDPDDNISAITCTLDGGAAALGGTSGIGTSHTASGVISTSTDGDHLVSCTATDSHSNITSPAATAHLKLDTVAPAVTATPSRAADSGDWYTAPFTVTFTATDSTSDHVICDSPASYSGPDTSSGSVPGSCSDEAGNTGSTSFLFKYDATGPSAAATPDREADHNGWYNHPVTVTFSSTDATATCASAVAYSGPDSGTASVTGSCTDPAGNSTPATFNFKYDATAPIGVATTLDRIPDHLGWYNHAVGWTTTGSDATSDIASCSSGTYSGPDGSGLTVSGTCTDVAGNTSAEASSAPFDFDATAPTDVATTLDRGPDHLGWYNHAVGWTTTGSDATSDIASCSSGTYSGPDGSGLTVSGTCTDVAGNTSAEASSAPFDFDATAPTDVATTLDRGPDHLGWYNHAVGWTTTGSDATSDIASCSSGTYSGPDGSGLTVSGTCTDVAGNTSDPVDSPLFDFDATAPAITFVSRTPANTNGWNNSAVTVTWTCSDATSGELEPSVSDTKTGEGASQTASGTCEDAAGNTAADSLGQINIDETPPTVTPDSVTDSVWRNSDLSQSFTASDDLSGLENSADASFTLTASLESLSGFDPTVDAKTVYDKAGNSTERSISALIDRTAPVITDLGPTSGPDGDNGWYRSAVVNQFSAGDGLSGLADAGQASFTVASGSSEGSAVTINSGPVSDAAGNANPGIDSVPFKVDLTDPVIEFVSRTPANDNGWNNDDVIVTWSCSDAVSGVVAAEVSQTVSEEGLGQSATGTCTDNAGRTASGIVEDINIDKTAPIAAATPDRPFDHNHWYNHAVTISFDGTDALSGIDSCSLSATYNGPDSTTASESGICTDKAGNTAPASFGFKFDKTGPSAALAVTAGTPGTNGWYTSDVTVATSGSDSISDPVTCSADQQQTTETTGSEFNGSCTNDAGLTTDAAPLSVKLDKTGPSAALAVTAGTPGTNGWYTSDVTVATSGSDSISDPVTCSADQQQTTETTGSEFNGSCTNDAGLTTDAAPLSVKLDKTGPSAALAVTAGTPGTNGWYTSDVTVATSGSDSISDPVTCSADQQQTTETTGSEFNGSCTNDAGLTTDAAPLSVKLDKTAPTGIAFVGGGITEGASYYYGFVPAGPSGCTADGSISGLASCSVTGFLMTVGPHTITANAVDQAGNHAQAFLNYHVLKWTLKGFFAPVDMRSTSAPGLWNTVKGGSTVPLKFQIFAGSTELTDVADITSFTAASVSCATSDPTETAVEVTTTGGTVLRYTGGQFIQNWQTPKAAGKCYVTTVTTADGSWLSAYFKLK